MRIEKYILESESSLTVFEFVSEGPRGKILKRIEFQKTDNPVFYNLAFGDKHPETGEIDDTVVSDNGDSEKILATVVEAVYLFFMKHPFTLVYATGSTPSRTRLYRMGITKFYGQMVEDFYLYGQVGNEFSMFETGKEYTGFLAQRKKTNLPI